MAVDAARHRRGIGTALLERAEQELRAGGVRFLQVKTLGPSYPDEEYERTRLFYEARRFVPLEEIFGAWAQDNPMLILIKAPVTEAETRRERLSDPRHFAASGCAARAPLSDDGFPASTAGALPMPITHSVPRPGVSSQQ